MKQLLPEQIQAKQAEIASARQASQQMEAEGLRPLRAETLLHGIKSRLGAPEIRASDVASKTLGHLEEKLNALKSKHGTIDAFDLYMVRKELGNNIQKFAEESKTFDKKFTAGILRDVQLAIDNEIEKAGGNGWKDYLAKYQELSQPINRMQEGQRLKEALVNPLQTGERSQVFAKAASDVDPRALGEADRSAIDAIVQDLTRKDAATRLARGTNLSGAQAIPGNVGVPLPNLLSRQAMIANFLMKRAGQSAEDKIAQRAAIQYLNPQILAHGLQPIPPRYAPLIDALTTQAIGAGGTVIGRNY